MRGAEAMIQTLLQAGVDVCFTNPGTSEMHFVAALDQYPQMRAVLTLFEGVASGAADGYARMLGKPAATLLHLGCGLGNALANLHNARKARSPIINIVGEHATYHVPLNAQLQSDISTVARNVSRWIRTVESVGRISADVAEAFSVSMATPHSIATLIVPADTTWAMDAEVVSIPPLPLPQSADTRRIDEIAQLLKSGARTTLLLGGRALQEPWLSRLAVIAEQTGSSLLAEVFPARMSRGAGIPPVPRLAYFAEMASVQLSGIEHLIRVDCPAPVSFFAYPDKKSELVPECCKVHTLLDEHEAIDTCIAALEQILGCMHQEPMRMVLARPKLPRGKLTAEKVCKAIGALLPEHAIIVDEAQTSGVMLPFYTAASPEHDLLTLTGGAIGQGLPVAVGAAIACPDRPVLALVGDGAAMYTPQALWTMAREHLNITSIIFNNASYSILNVELQRVGASGGQKALDQLRIDAPALDFLQLGRSMGIHSQRVDTAEDLIKALEFCLANPGPHLIEAMVPPALAGIKLRLLPHLLRSLSKIPLPMARFIKQKIAP